MKRNILILVIIISLGLFIGVFHDQHGKIISKIAYIWLIFFVIYSNLINKKEVNNNK